MFLHYSCRVRLNISFNTSGCHHLSPYLPPKPMLSVVGTCCKAKGLKGAMARLRDAALDVMYWDMEWFHWIYD